MSKGSESEQRGDKKQEFESCHFRLIEWRGRQWEGGKADDDSAESILQPRSDFARIFLDRSNEVERTDVSL